MRILIDESLPRRLAAELGGYDVSTVRREEWTGLRNGVLLRAAVDAGFDVLITADSLPNQQNLLAIGIGVLVITRVRNRIKDVRRLLPQIVSALRIIRPGEALEITPRRDDSIRDRSPQHGAHATVMSVDSAIT